MARKRRRKRRPVEHDGFGIATHRLAAETYSIRARSGLKWAAWAAECGLPESTLNGWRKYHMPRADLLDRALAVLGYRLEIHPVRERRHLPDIAD